jgi:protein TonB
MASWVLLMGQLSLMLGVLGGLSERVEEQSQEPAPTHRPLWATLPEDPDADRFCCFCKMTPPQLLSGGAMPRYTPEALEARVRGTVIARCTLTREGTVEDCRIIKGLPYMNDAVIEALERRRYRPVYFEGRPVTVSYIFNVKLQLP